MNSKTLAIIIIALVIIVPSASYGGLQYLEPKKDVVAVGSNVSLWYYGYVIVNGNPLVFDTNMQSIANNNTSYPKAPDFTYHPPFTVLNDTVGSGGMIKGFDNGLVGMAKGQSGIITVAPSQGYGLTNQSLVHKVSLNGSVPMYQVLNYTQFTGIYNTTPLSGEVLNSPYYGWKVLILSYNSSTIFLQNEPVTGQQYFPFNTTKEFSIVVESTSGTGLNTMINYNTQVTIGAKLPNSFYVSSVSGGYYYLDSNSYLVGKTLYFYVDIVSIS